MAACRSSRVFFTMHVRLEPLVERLSRHYPPETPIALVMHAGYKEKQQVIQGTPQTILEQTEERSLPFQHLIYLGDFMAASGASKR
ncbi:MAG: hypothetical protein R6X08_12480 [Desulfosalsimonadaceae bacterium]